MRLSEAIIHCEEVADRCAVTDGDVKCEMEHRQLAEWLKELQRRRAEQQWIPCTPSELPKDKLLWVTHDTGLYRYVGEVCYDMTDWSEPVSDVVAYMEREVPEPYRE